MRLYNSFITITMTTIEKIIKHGEEGKDNWDGFTLIMSDTFKNVTCKIDSTQECCENFGVHINCKLDDYIGAEYVTAKISEPKYAYDTFEMSEIAVTIHTNKGIIVITLYNEHNGSYPHDVYIKTESNAFYNSI